MEKLAIIRDVNIGVGDYGHPALWFTVYLSKCEAALQVFNWEQAGKLIEESGVRNVSSLNGMSCIVDEQGHMIKFMRMTGI